MEDLRVTQPRPGNDRSRQVSQIPQSQLAANTELLRRQLEPDVLLSSLGLSQQQERRAVTVASCQRDYTAAAEFNSGVAELSQQSGGPVVEGRSRQPSAAPVTAQQPVIPDVAGVTHSSRGCRCTAVAHLSRGCRWDGFRTVVAHSSKEGSCRRTAVTRASRGCRWD